ncbi:MAG: nucleotidyltransferase substrate binding protein [Planctomycetaceae bacterium]|jgi:hypothetical protein|nr:nucleotidyltransferase substrate binding protein [Planctomycetaceae bacterium]
MQTFEQSFKEMQIRNSDKLIRAMKSLEDAIKYARSDNFQELDNSFKSVLQAAVVQNFSLTFNVCRKMLMYKLQDAVGLDVFGKDNANAESTKSLIKTAANEGLISNLNNWLEYTDCEYLTHSSNSTIRTFEKANSFLQDAAELLLTCTKRKNNERRAA